MLSAEAELIHVLSSTRRNAAEPTAALQARCASTLLTEVKLRKAGKTFACEIADARRL